MQTLFQDQDDGKNAPGGQSGGQGDGLRMQSVLVPYPVDKAYTYLVPENMTLAAGMYVTVPLGGREVPGIVWDRKDDEQNPVRIKTDKLKTIITEHDLPPLPDVHRRFIDWVAQYTMSPVGFVMKMTLSVPAALEPPKPAKGYSLSPMAKNADPEKLYKNLSPQRRRILEILRDGLPRRASELADEAGCTPGVVKGLYESKLLENVDLFSLAPCRNPDPDFGRVTLSDMQEHAAKHLRKIVAAKDYNVTLIDGVTGAGKTEVYFEAIAEALKQDKQVVLMLPEIALSNAFLGRFKKRFGCAPALWHSSLSAGQRKRTWRGVAEGDTRVVVGARSALFLPYQDLGLIIIDEEHDPAYKQEDNVIYNARDMAIVRAHLGKLPVVLVSATPSLETIVNAWDGRYDHLHLPSRHGAARLPDVHLIDLKKDKPSRQHFISDTLKQALQKNLENKEQSLLFLNRRGYAPLTVCKTCGFRVECPRCTAWLVEHRHTGRLHCHHCGFASRVPEKCPSCDDEDSLVACGPGVERVKEEIEQYFPDARLVVMTSDLMTDHDVMRQTLDEIIRFEYDIIIGTQIIAKGHHFPHLTCVGVVDADIGLKGGDLRAAERTFQLLHQVAGRAGREEKPGQVYLQTFIPENKVMAALKTHDRDTFYDVEVNEREESHMPPFSRLVGIIVAGKDEELVMETARALGQTAPFGPQVKTLGPAEAPIYRLRGTYRRRLLVQADKMINVQKTVASWLSQHKIPSTIRVYVDIDPYSFL